jgi:hypothetical protein
MSKKRFDDVVRSCCRWLWRQNASAHKVCVMSSDIANLPWPDPAEVARTSIRIVKKQTKKASAKSVKGAPPPRKDSMSCEKPIAEGRGASEKRRLKRIRRGIQATIVSAGSQKSWFEEALSKLTGHNTDQCLVCDYTRNPLRLKSAESNNAQTANWAWDWSKLPRAADPSFVYSASPHHVAASRGTSRGKKMEWKRLQVENLAFFVHLILQHPKYSAGVDGHQRQLTIVDFCGGSGYVALPLACKWPQHRFVLVDLKQRSLDIAAERVRSAGLTNVLIQKGLVQVLHRTYLHW